jgi:hypothetical protein
MTLEECKLKTIEHINLVRKYIRFFTDKLTDRGEKHDASKLTEDELPYFAEHTDKLNEIEYGSEEYKAELEALKPALEHHYASNTHHPEHFQNGIEDMTLWDIVEMFCDWKASTKRQRAGNILKSIDINAERFDIEPQLKQILINTAKMMEDYE